MTNVINITINDGYDRKRARPKYLSFSVPSTISKKTRKEVLMTTISVTDDHDVRVGLVWSDDVGVIAHPPTTGVTFTSTDASVVTNCDLSTDGTSFIARTGADGSSDVSVTWTPTSGTPVSSTVTFVVGAPSPTSLAFGSGSPVAKGAAA